ncbi:MAG: hypothetical protein NVSMB19_06710 [Vulcanimicrobiaceae bacterium]
MMQRRLSDAEAASTASGDGDADADELTDTIHVVAASDPAVRAAVIAALTGVDAISADVADRIRRACADMDAEGGCAAVPAIGTSARRKRRSAAPMAYRETCDIRDSGS